MSNWYPEMDTTGEGQATMAVSGVLWPWLFIQVIQVSKYTDIITLYLKNQWVAVLLYLLILEKRDILTWIEHDID